MNLRKEINDVINRNSAENGCIRSKKDIKYMDLLGINHNGFTEKEKTGCLQSLSKK